MVRLNVSGEGSVEDGFRDGFVGAEEVGVKGMLGVVGGDEIEEEGFGVAEIAAGEERREESEERFRV